MTSKVIFRMALRGAFIVTVLTTTYACNFTKRQTSNDLTFVQCDPNGKIVPVTQPGSVPSVYEIIFVCPGNPVEWVTDDDFKFTVDFDPSATDLFVSKKIHFDSAPDSTGQHKHAIKGEKVSKDANKYQDHPYKIHPTGTPIPTTAPTSDPHVIPM